MNDFIYVQRKKGRRRKGVQETKLDDYVTQIQSFCERIATSELMVALVHHVKTSNVHWQRIHCLALGSPSMFVKSRIQLAFLLGLNESTEKGGITIFDPLFNDMDREIFKTLSIEIKEPIDEVSNMLVFLPHAPLAVVEKVLSLGANPIICNDLHLYETRYLLVSSKFVEPLGLKKTNCQRKGHMSFMQLKQ